MQVKSVLAGDFSRRLDKYTDNINLESCGAGSGSWKITVHTRGASGFLGWEESTEVFITPKEITIYQPLSAEV